MGSKIDEILGSMTATELAALEGELDKRAGELAVEHYYGLGAKLAQEEIQAWKQSGELGSLLHLVKVAIEPPDGKIRAKFKEMAQGKATTQELKEVAQAQAGKQAAEDDDEDKDKKKKKLPPWLRKEKDEDEKEEERDEKEDEEEEKEEEKKKKDEKESSLDELLEKASAEELAEFEKVLDEKLAAREYAAFYEGCGRKLARELTKSGARVPAGLFQSFTKSLPKGGLKTMMTGVGQFAKAHPIATGAMAGVGGTLVGQKLLGQPDRR